MEYDPNKTFSPLNADKVTVGSKGYFADSVKDLKWKVKHNALTMKIIRINKYAEYPFYVHDFVQPFRYFYLVQEA